MNEEIIVELFEPTYVDLGFNCSCGDTFEYIEVEEEEDFFNGYYSTICQSCKNRPEFSETIGLRITVEGKQYEFFLDDKLIPRTPDGHAVSYLVEEWILQEFHSDVGMT